MESKLKGLDIAHQGLLDLTSFLAHQAVNDVGHLLNGVLQLLLDCLVCVRPLRVLRETGAKDPSV